MNEFSERTLQNINQNGKYYVYGLIDPRDGQLFYIGKGTGNRVFQHVVESNKNPESEKNKIKRIREIEYSGNHVKHILIHWGLKEEEAFAAEASLINLINYISDIGLSNIVSGHHTQGCMSVEEVERLFGAELLSKEDFRHKVLIIKINKTYNPNISAEDLYNSVRGIWRANISRVQKVEYVLGVYNNLIVACYKPERWYQLGDDNVEKLPKSMLPEDWTQIKGRVFFECEYLSELDDVQKFYLYKSIKKLEYIQKSQNPIIYVGI